MKKFPTHIVSVTGIVQKENKVLLVKHNTRNWVPPGGQVENGESLTSAIVREVLEESGIEIVVEKLFFVGSNVSSHPGYGDYDLVPTKVTCNFICRYINGEIRSSDENSESAWIDREDAITYIEDASMKEQFKNYLEYDGTISYYEYITKPSFQILSKIKL